MKKLVIIMVVLGVGGVVVVGLLLFKGISSIGAGLIDATDSFLLAAHNGDYARAQTYLSESYRASNNEAALRTFMKTSLLENYASSSWNSRRITNNQGYLEGSVTTTTGGVIPMKVELVDENGWKIVSMSTSTAASGAGVGTDASIPEKVAQVAMVRRSFRDFTASLRQGSMNGFHSTLAGPFREQFSPERLDSIYAAFFTLEADWSILDTTEPIFDPSSAVIDSNGVLLLKGIFPTKPSQVSFAQKFLREGGDWRLVGFNVNVGESVQ